MYDPYPARPTLRLGVNLQQVKAHHEERADIRRQIEVLLARDCELTMLMESEHAQSMPIAASESGMITSISTQKLNAVDLLRGEASPNKGHVGIPGNVAPITDNDFWDQRHRALIQAAASGEIRDPAESLRHSHMMHEPLYEDDGA